MRWSDSNVCRQCLFLPTAEQFRRISTKLAQEGHAARQLCRLHRVNKIAAVGVPRTWLPPKAEAYSAPSASLRHLLGRW